MTIFLPHSSPLKKKILPVVLFALFILPMISIAETVDTEEWQIEADKITRYEQPKSIIAEGSIVLTKLRKLPPATTKEKSTDDEWSDLLEEAVIEKELTPEEIPEEGEPRYETKVVIKADWMAYDVTLKNIKARGHVSIKMGDDQLYAEKGTVNLNKMTGTFTNATILREEKDFHLEGKIVEKTGFKTYHVTDGWVITCKIDTGETPPWSFAAADTVVTKGGYAFLKHARFNIHNVPVFYTPYMVLPAKDTRQTGLLFPEFSFSEINGVGVNIPFFLNISNSMDLTFYPEFLANRGFMPGIEFRYINSSKNKGLFMGAYLDDQLTDPSETSYYADTGYTHTNSDRYWFRGKVDHTFGEDWTTRLDLDIVSDKDYLGEFNHGITGFKESNNESSRIFGRGFENTTDNERENTFKVEKSWDEISFTGKFLGINDVSETEATTTTTNDDGTTTTVTNSTPLWQLPSFEFDGTHTVGSLGDSDITLSWDADYVYYWREQGLGGHRIDLYPKLSMPIPFGPYLESRAEAGIRETFYMVETNGDEEWEYDDTPNRFMYDFNAEVGTTLLRDFSLNSSTYQGWTHEIRPSIKYTYVADVDQDDLPQFNSVDSISHSNQVTYEIKNYFSLFGVKDDEEFTDQFAEVTLKQSYDFRDESSDEPFGDVELELKLTPADSFNLEYKTKFDVYDTELTYHRLSSSYSDFRGDMFELDYTFENDGETDQLNAKVYLNILSSLTGKYEIKYSLADDEINEQSGSLTYQAACWSVTLKTSSTPEDTNFMFVFELLNLGSPLRVSM